MGKQVTKHHSGRVRKQTHKKAALHVGFKDWKIGGAYEHREDLARDDANHPDNIVSSANPIRRISTASGKITKKKIRAKKFANKVQKALQSAAPINVWHQYGDDGSANWHDQIINAVTPSGRNQFISGSKSMYVMNPGDQWLSTTSSQRLYPWGPLYLTQAAIGDTAVTLTRNVEADTLITTHARGDYSLYNNSTIPLCVDIYTFIAAVDIADSAYKDPITTMNTLLASPNWVKAYGTALYTNTFGMTTKGITPLDVPELGKYWKQQTKTRVNISSGAQDYFTFPQLRKCHFTEPGMNNMYAIKGKTQAMFIVCNSANASTLLTVANVLDVVGTQDYHYKFKNGGSVPGGTAPRPFVTAISN